MWPGHDKQETNENILTLDVSDDSARAYGNKRRRGRAMTAWSTGRTSGITAVGRSSKNRVESESARTRVSLLCAGQATDCSNPALCISGLLFTGG